MNIKEKLRQIESTRARKPAPSLAPFIPVRAGFETPITEVIDGCIKEAEGGRFFYCRKDFPEDYLHGNTPIASVLERPSGLLTQIAKSKAFDNIDLGRLLFLDTETSGLSGGSGTFAFLIGLGYFVDTTFRVTQFFMNDFNEESPLLHELNRIIQNHEVVVSYNGKSYDIPLIDSRNITHRINSSLTQLQHLDLLHAVRRLWKSRLPDCSLSTTENELLGVQRSGDIPGYLIPHLYFSYLQNRNARLLRPIFYHNRQDILTMAALLVKLLEVFESPLQRCQDSDELLAIGKIHEALNEPMQAVSFYEAGLEKASGQAQRYDLLLRIASVHKRLASWQEAKASWQRCLSEPFHPLPYIELAKHYEHREKDPVRAMTLVDKAWSEIKLIEELRGGFLWQAEMLDLSKRKKRLRRKLRSMNSS